MVNRLLICRSACFFTSSVMHCSMLPHEKMSGLVFDIGSICGTEHGLRSLRLHVIPSYRFVRHEFLHLDVIQDSNRLVLIFLRINLDQVVNHCRCVWRLQDLLHQAGNEKYFCSFLVQRFTFFTLARYAEVESVARSRPRLGYSLGFPSERNCTCKNDHLVQCACQHIVVQNNRVTATVMIHQICVLNSPYIEVRNTIIICATALLVQCHSWFMD